MTFLARIIAAARGGYGWVSMAMFARAGLQAIIVILLARALGATEYGLVIAIASVTSIFSIFMGVGATTLHLRDLSAESIDSAQSYALALRRNLQTTIPLAGGALLPVYLLYGRNIGVVMALGLILGDLFSFAMSDLLQRTMQGRRLYRGMAGYMCLVPALRFAALVLILGQGWPMGIGKWAAIAFASGLIPLAIALFRRKRASNNTPPGMAPDHRWIEGLGFAVAASSTRVHADADKAIIAGFSTLDLAAQYSVAYRFFDVLMLPILSLIEWRMPSLFHSGATAKGLNAIRENRAFIVTISATAVAMCGLSFFLVGFLPLVFGEGYRETAMMGRWLALLPVTASLWWIFRTLLSTTGDQATGGVIELGGAAFTVLLTIGLVMWLGWFGAVIGTYATHVAMSLAAGIRMFGSSRRNARCA